jgi:hypothetical protein
VSVIGPTFHYFDVISGPACRNLHFKINLFLLILYPKKGDYLRINIVIIEKTWFIRFMLPVGKFE